MERGKLKRKMHPKRSTVYMRRKRRGGVTKEGFEMEDKDLFALCDD